jgi:nucleotidyltransferase-like protein
MTDAHAPYRALARRAAAALAVPGLRSVYLIGSLARGSFTPGLSDIDLLAFADGAPTATVELWTHSPRTLISICVRPLEQLYDPFGPLRWSGRPEPRTHKELTAVSDLMFLCDHGELLHGPELRALCVLPTRARYRAYLRWEGAVAAHGPLRPGIADNPRRAAKRIATLLRDLRFLHTGRIGARPAELLAFLRRLVDDEIQLTAMAALWLSGLPAQRDYGSSLAHQAIERVMTHRERTIAVCSEIGELTKGASLCGWVQLADLSTESFMLCGDGDLGFADARPNIDSRSQ